MLRKDSNFRVFEEIVEKFASGKSNGPLNKVQWPPQWLHGLLMWVINQEKFNRSVWANWSCLHEKLELVLLNKDK